jgi:hypothetical protein
MAEITKIREIEVLSSLLEEFKLLEKIGKFPKIFFSHDGLELSLSDIIEVKGKKGISKDDEIDWIPLSDAIQILDNGNPKIIKVKRRRRTHAKQAAGHTRRRRIKPKPS